MEETNVEYDDDPMGNDPYWDEDDEEFVCPECGEDLDREDECVNSECPCFDGDPPLLMSDWEERQHERKQMGVGL